jgi:hypothetical protein
MKSLRTFVAVASLATASGQALALESSGQTIISWGGKQSVHRFTTQVEPSTGVFSREGTITLASGREVTYRLDGACRKGAGCNWTATARGPLGGTWRGAGTLNRPSPARAILAGEITAPTGQVITVSRDVDGNLVEALAAIEFK